jgi:type VI secretion system secreted protein Hcp
MDMASSIFAKIGSIKGESRDARHKDEIDVLSWSWGVSQTGSSGHVGGGMGAGKTTLEDLTFTHHLDKASPLLMKACATGQHLPEAVITASRAAGGAAQDYLIITLTDVLVRMVSTSASAEADASLESVVLGFTKVDLQYKPQKADGTLDAAIPFTFDVRANKSG